MTGGFDESIYVVRYPNGTYKCVFTDGRTDNPNRSPAFGDYEKAKAHADSVGGAVVTYAAAKSLWKSKQSR